MTLSLYCKKKGFKSAREAARLAGISYACLCKNYKNDKILFNIYIKRALEAKNDYHRTNI